MHLDLGGQAFGQTSEWLHCRGPAYDGHAPSSGVHLPWPAQGPRVLWRQSLGEGYSGLVVSGTRVFPGCSRRYPWQCGRWRWPGEETPA